MCAVMLVPRMDETSLSYSLRPIHTERELGKEYIDFNGIIHTKQERELCC